MFDLSTDRISITPDFSRRTPIDDTDDRYNWVSLGCATDNMVIAAAALGKHADVKVDPDGIRATFDSGPSAPSPLVEAFANANALAPTTIASRWRTTFSKTWNVPPIAVVCGYSF